MAEWRNDVTVINPWNQYNQPSMGVLELSGGELPTDLFTWEFANNWDVFGFAFGVTIAEPEPERLKACPSPPPPVKSWCCAPEPAELTPVVYPWEVEGG